MQGQPPPETDDPPAFATAWRRRADLPADPDEVRPWLFGIARRCLANANRSTHRASRLGVRSRPPGPTSPPDPAAQHDDRAQNRQLRNALEQLADGDRDS